MAAMYDINFNITLSLNLVWILMFQYYIVCHVPLYFRPILWYGDNSYGIIGAHSCNNGNMTCNLNGSDSNGTIGDHSCNGELNSCVENGAYGTEGIMGNNACNAPGACKENKGTICDG